jgi:hypothetical protein
MPVHVFALILAQFRATWYELLLTIIQCENNFVFLHELIQKLNVLVRLLRNWYGAYDSLHLLCIVMCPVVLYLYFVVWNSHSLSFFERFELFRHFKLFWYFGLVHFVLFVCSDMLGCFEMLWVFWTFWAIQTFWAILVFRPGPFCVVCALRYARAFGDVVGGLSSSVIPCCFVIFILWSYDLLLLWCYYTYTYEAIRTTPPFKTHL